MVYHKTMKRGAPPLKATDRGRAPERTIMKNAHAINVSNAIIDKCDPLSLGVGDDVMDIIGQAVLGHNAAPHIVLTVEATSGTGSDLIVGYGYRLDVAYRRIRGRLEELEERGWAARTVSVGVLAPDAKDGANYKSCGWYTFEAPVTIRELRRLAGGELSGRGLVSAANQVYYMRNLGRGDDTEAKMRAEIEALSRIDKTAHAAQMWFSRHYHYSRIYPRTA